MAGAVTACVPARAGTILGVTRSDANPTYRRLERYEPLLRLAVPAVLILFLITLAGSAWIQLTGIRSAVDPDGLFVGNHPLPRLFEDGRATA